MIPDNVWLALLTVLINAAVTYGVIKSEMRYWRRAINAAHRRLDLHGAPPAGGDWLPE